jgi:copper transport protein
LVLLVIALPLLGRIFPGDRPIAEYPLTLPWRVGAVIVGAALVATPGLGGHAASGDYVPFAVVADALHVGAIAVWLGGLVILVVAMLPRADARELRSVVPRYSQVALACVAVIVLTGAFQSWRQVGSLTALRDTDFGRLLALKLLIFKVLIVVAAFSREVVNRKFRERTATKYARIAAEAAEASGSGDNPVEFRVLDDATEVRNLRRSVVIEVVLAAGILVVASLLVNTPPARSEVGGPHTEVLRGEDIWVDVVVDPAQVGENDLHVTALLPGGTPTDVLEMQVDLTLPDEDIAPIDVPLRRLGPGHYISSAFNVPIRGDWELTADVLMDETTEVAVNAEVPIR